jgi:hypothetical protein
MALAHRTPMALVSLSAKHISHWLIWTVHWLTTPIKCTDWSRWWRHEHTKGTSAAHLKACYSIRVKRLGKTRVTSVRITGNAVAIRTGHLQPPHQPAQYVTGIYESKSETISDSEHTTIYWSFHNDLQVGRQSSAMLRRAAYWMYACRLQLPTPATTQKTGIQKRLLPIYSHHKFNCYMRRIYGCCENNVQNRCFVVKLNTAG